MFESVPGHRPLADADAASARSAPTAARHPEVQALERQPSQRFERWLTLSGIAFTLTASLFVTLELGALWIDQARAGRWGELVAHSLFLLIVASLVYGGLVYQFTRLGYLDRLRAHRPASRDVLDTLHDRDAPRLTILVPSYKEDEGVVTKTLLSAALQDYPKRRVVLLIDDPPRPGDRQDAAALAATRALPGRLTAELRARADFFAARLASLQARVAAGPLNLTLERARLITLHLHAATWFKDQIAALPVQDHVDTLFIERVLAAHRADLLQRAETLRQGDNPDLALLLRQHRRLHALFDVEITSFERKRYVNLSHEPNKAMNLNSYIDLVGKRLREQATPAGLQLVEAGAGRADLEVPDTDYFVTLDADSIISPDYASRLIHLMEQPEHARTAVAQTPYSAIPGAPGALERVAGATTDIQYIIHQGFTHYDATYWVGANALLRKAALADIAVQETERGYPVMRYIQDRTVIEDTESSVDLVDRGWKLYNYPERLAYSATPPDFGSLVIQRRRWANGGLIILPKLVRYLLRGKASRGEGFMRFHYLASIAAVNAGLLILLAVPFTESISSIWLPLTALPYFVLYGRDLTRIGYRVSDLFRVYALNLLMIPVNLGGVLKSLQQAWTKAKIPFGRTPKVAGRTAAPALYVLAGYALLAQWLVAAGVDMAAGRWPHGLFALVNSAFLLYALLTFIGLRESREDLRAGLGAEFAQWFRRPAPVVAAVPQVPAFDPIGVPALRLVATAAGRGDDALTATVPALRRRDRYFYAQARNAQQASGWFFTVREHAGSLGPFATRAAAEQACADFLGALSDSAEFAQSAG